MSNIGGKRWKFTLCTILFAAILAVAWRTPAAAQQQSLAEKLLEVMKANHQITEEQYEELKKQAEDEKAAQTEAIRGQIKAEMQNKEKTEAAVSRQVGKTEVQQQEAGSGRSVAAQTVQTAVEKKSATPGLPADTSKDGGVAFDLKGITVNFGGFIEAASIYRGNNLNSDIASPFNKLPLRNQANYYQDETRFTARQSRLGILAQGDYNPALHLAGYYEMDFLGAAATSNSNESNSYTPRIRHIYGTADWDTWGLHVLAGQTWSLVTMNDAGITPRKEDIPWTIDAQYVPGFTWARQPQFRIVKDWDKTYWLGVSIENPQTTAASTPNAVPTNYSLSQAGADSLTGVNLSVNDVPDIVVKAAWEPGWGHFEVYDLIRTFNSSLEVDHSLNNKDLSTNAVGGGFILPIIKDQLKLQFSGLHGDGIGRYGSGQLPDVTQDSKGDLHPITETQLLGGLVWEPTKAWTIYGYYGRESADRDDLASGGKGYGYGSYLYDTDVGVIGSKFQGQIETIDQITVGAWWAFFQGKYGTMKAGLQYSYTENAYFSGTTKGPKTYDNMFFTSLRYYWH